LRIAKLRENVRKEGEYRCDVCKKDFCSNTALRSHRSYCSSNDEATDVACDQCGRIFKRHRGLTWHLRSHEAGFFDEHSRKISKGLETQKPRKRNSEAELAFKSVLEAIHGDEVIHRFRVDTINHEFDFCVPSIKLIVEFDGDYWHGNPDMHQLTPKMKRQFRIDLSFTRAGEALGYTVHRVWASEAVNYPSKLRKM
jgi:very-short-patch-repair endonuclease/DNA-directed RNA polymerase subunit RPC12/RpoP